MERSENTTLTNTQAHAICKETLMSCGIATLETQGLDALDFHDMGNSSLKDIIEAAYNAGVKEGAAKAEQEAMLDQVSGA